MNISEKTRIINVGKKPLRDYVIEIILAFQEGFSEIALKGIGPYISKTVDLYNLLLTRIGDSVELMNVSIGSDKFKGKIRPYILIKIRRKY
ncbi:MAG: DNA-binding protein [Desulfurococcaceae archaeon]